MFPEDTIAAIATPVGVAGIGVVRVSGPDALSVATRVFRRGEFALSHFQPRFANFGKLIDPVDDQTIDDVVLTVFHGPASYTGEDVVEISCHGGIAVLRAALSAAVAAGARPAEPGEFTKRAFLNGKLDLAQAEAVNDLIRASADGARKAAMHQLGGGLSGRIKSLRELLLGLLASIEAAIDFPDDVPAPEFEEIRAGVEGVRSEIESLRSSYQTGRIYREGLRVVIAGRVNVGKSSLLNALLKCSRAIVTPTPGTTRDVIEESLQIEGIPVVAIDTAGIRQTNDPVEKIGVELTEQMLESADIILLVVDISEGVHNADVELMNRLGHKHAIIVLNKIDLLPEKARGLVTEKYVGRLGRSVPTVQTCAFSGQGIGLLENEIARQAAGTACDSALVTNVRHERLLQSASESLSRASAAAVGAQPIDLISIDLTSAAHSLGQITGETATEDLLDRIFSEFCIGK